MASLRLSPAAEAIRADFAENPDKELQKKYGGRATHAGYHGHKFEPLNIPPEGRLVSKFYDLCRSRGYLNPNGSIDTFRLIPLLHMGQPDLWSLAQANRRMRLSEKKITRICRAFDCQPGDLLEFRTPNTPTTPDTVQDIQDNYQNVSDYTDLYEDLD